MFKSVPMGLATLTLLSSECYAKRVSFRPPPGTAPWHEDDSGKAKTHDNPGLKAVQQKSLLQLQSDPVCASSGCNQYKHPKQKEDHPINYAVPDYGKDHDRIHTDASLNTAETMLGHKWNWVKDTSKDPPRDYFVPNFGMDRDIADSLSNMKGAVQTHGSWDLPKDDWFVQTEQKSDPICNSQGCTQYLHPHDDSHPKDYFVPNFGKDKDIHTNENSLDWAEKSLGHKWNWKKKDEKDKVEYNQAPKLDDDMITSQANLKATDPSGSWKPVFDVQLQADVSSDPICSSAGCGQYKHPKKDRGYDIDYPVANWGDKDQDIVQHDENLPIAEKIVGHHWNFVLEKPPLNPAKKTLYDYSPKLEGDMIAAAHSLDLAEDQLGHKYAAWMVQLDDIQNMAEIEAQAKSDPICASSGCWKSDYSKKVDDKIVQYPQDGLDADVRGSLKHADNAEEYYGHTWDPWA